MKTLSSASKLTRKILEEGSVTIETRTTTVSGACNLRIINKTAKGYRAGLKLRDSGKIVNIQNFTSLAKLKYAIS